MVQSERIGTWKLYDRVCAYFMGVWTEPFCNVRFADVLLQLCAVCVFKPVCRKSLILLIDLASFVFAFCILLFYIKILEQVQNKAYSSPFAGIVEGFDFLKKENTIPAGIILGGWLADYVFEPFIVSGSRLAKMLGTIVGNGAGSGMAVMFLCTGICGFVVSVASCFNREIKKLS